MVSSEVKSHDSDAAVQGDDFKFDDAIYHEVSCAAALKEIRLVASKFMVKPDFFFSEEGYVPKSTFEGSVSDVVIDEQEGFIAGHYIWTAEIKFGRKTGLKLRADYVLIYSGVGGLDPDHINFYFNKIGRFSTYPYFRSHFSNHVSEAGLMLPPLPSLNERVD